MRYRLVTTRADGEQRSIDYATRSAAFGHFSSIAHSRTLATASLLKRDETGGVDDGPDWKEVAHMEIRRHAEPLEPM